jgi:hypothetical protein
MAGSGQADDIIRAALKALEESRAGGKIDDIAGGAENALRDIITNLVSQAKSAAGVKPPKPPRAPKPPKVVETPAVPAETALKPSQIRRAENQAAWAADKERRRLAMIEAGEDRASIKIRNRAEHAASQKEKYGKGKGSNRATERDSMDIPKAPKAPKAPKVEEVKPTRARSANSKRIEAENDLQDMRTNKNSFTKDEFAQGLSDAAMDGARLTKKEQDIVDLYNDSKLNEGFEEL